MKYTDIFVRGQLRQVQQMVEQIFIQDKFNIQWINENTAKAERGSKGMNVAFGAFAQRFEIDFQIFVQPDQSIAVRLFKSNTGGWGGVVGVARVSDKYNDIIDKLSNYFYSQGMYIGRNPP